MEFYQQNYGEDGFIKEARESLPAEGDLIIQATAKMISGNQLTVTISDPLLQNIVLDLDTLIQDKLIYELESKNFLTKKLLVVVNSKSQIANSLKIKQILPLELLSYFDNYMTQKCLNIFFSPLAFTPKKEIFIRHRGTSELIQNGEREKLVFPPYSATEFCLKQIAIKDYHNVFSRVGLFERRLVVKNQEGKIKAGYQSRLIYLCPVQTPPKN